MGQLRISLIQSDIVWENKELNLEYFDKLLAPLAGKTDLAVLPEMFSTGFSMDSPQLAEPADGPTMETVRAWANRYGFAICGSYFAVGDGKIRNRGFFITPDGNDYFYDKRHLFRMGDENQLFTAGEKQTIIPYKGFNIRMIICYDLRFPVWARNVDKAYDLLVCPANWPQVRAYVWSTLLAARAIENYCYVCGVNRVGVDGQGLLHHGDSRLIDFKGNPMADAGTDQESIVTGILDKESLNRFREKFPVWKDADRFDIRY